MVDFKIPLGKIAFLITVFIALYKPIFAQESYNIRQVLSTLVNSDNENVDFSTLNNAAIIIVTDRRCDHCFVDACDYCSNLDTALSKNTYVVFFTEKNLLRMLDLHTQYNKLITCATDVLFFWTKNNQDSSLQNIYTQPSPQLVLIKNGQINYLPYSETNKVLFYPKSKNSSKQ